MVSYGFLGDCVLGMGIQVKWPMGDVGENLYKYLDALRNWLAVWNLTFIFPDMLGILI